MKYETLNYNDNGTIKVRMTIDDHVLEQDFETENLDENVRQGMAVFKSELDKNQPAQDSDITVGEVVQVTDLPELETE